MALTREQLARAVVVGGSAGIAVAVFLTDESATDLLIVLVCLFAALLAMMLTRDGMFRALKALARVRSLKIGGVELTQLLQEVAPSKGAATETETSKTPDRAIDIALELQARLTYVAKHILGTPDRPTFVTFGSLRADGYLSPAYVRAAIALTTLREDVAQLGGDAYESADDLLRTMLIRVMRACLRQRWTGIWNVEEYVPDGRATVDYILRREGTAAEIRVVPLQVNDFDRRLVRSTARRLEQPDPKAPPTWLIVIPNIEACKPARAETNVVQLCELDAALERLTRVAVVA